MPGIAGIISKKPREINKKDLSVMIDCMIHEPFYTSGAYADDQLGLYVGWVCHKGSFSDCMPVFNEERDLVLIFTGENFVDLEVTEGLRMRGHDFDPSNASYLIHLYENDKEGFLKNLNGWFSGLLVDLQKNKVVLFNDRYGMNRIYYHEGKGEFLFSSEAKSLLKVRPELRKIDMKSLGEFFACDCVLENRSLFSEVLVLPGGSAWTFHNSSEVKKDYYFKPEAWENQPVFEKEEFYKSLRETFPNILCRYFSSKEPIAMSLTGGLDTRMILACTDNRPGELPCYTFGSIYRDTFDVRVARKVADACHQPYYVLVPDNKFFSDYHSYAEETIYISDGCLDVSGSYDLYLNRLARKIAPIRMSGKFGSEVLRSFSFFKAVPLSLRLLHPDFNDFVQEAGRTLSGIGGGHKLSFTLFKEFPWHEYGRLSVEQSQLTYRTPYMDNDLVGLAYRAPEGARSTREIPLRLIKEGNPDLFYIITDLGYAGKSNFLFSKSVQFLRWFLFKAEWYYNVGMPHWLARLDHAFGALSPGSLILGRHKIDHYRMWLRNELSDYVQDVLLDRRTANRPYLNKKFLEEMVRCHLKGDRNYTNEINKALSAELIHRLLIENI